MNEQHESRHRLTHENDAMFQRHQKHKHRLDWIKFQKALNYYLIRLA